MDKFPMMWREKPSGELTIEKESLYTWFTVHCQLPKEGIWCAWVVGRQGELRLGVLEPVGDRAVIRRRFSDRMVTPLGGVLRGEIRPTVGDEGNWEPVKEPEQLFRTEWLRKQLRGKDGVLTREKSRYRLIALPYDKQKSFSLSALFCFAQIRKIGEKKYAVFAFDDREHPIFY